MDESGSRSKCMAWVVEAFCQPGVNGWNDDDDDEDDDDEDDDEDDAADAAADDDDDDDDDDISCMGICESPSWVCFAFSEPCQGLLGTFR